MKEIAEMTGIGVRTVHHVIKTWKDSGELSTFQNKNVVRKNLEEPWLEVT